ncbi:alpha/beta hydrolase [Sphingosinicella sp. YJ22]|uniref:alpha/beta hydrolase n=1 Tax=Sphingosinicella sp. YJ22 TaxID=1104780 RepID=UPI00140AC521|nr:alpha/beta hydrolase [Sphingosinicella sp. YJ22]
MSEPFVRPDVRTFLSYVNALPNQKAYQMPLADARNLLHASRHVADAPVGELAVMRDLVMEGPGGPLRLRLYDARETREPGPLMVFYHGGGWVLGDLDTHEPFCAEVARQMDLPVVAVDYRLAPEHPFPAGIDDAIAAARWLAGSPEALERQVTGLVPFGDSAGGNFAVVVSLCLRDDPAAVPVVAQWPIYPASEPTRRYPCRDQFGDGFLLSSGSMDWFDKCYAGDKADWRFAPLAKDQAGMPPTLITTAGLDPIRDQGRVYAAALVQAGVDTIYLEMQGTVHGFINLRRALPSANDDVARSVAALKLLVEKGR